MADHFVSLTEELVEWRGFLARPENIPLPRPGAYRLVHIENGKSYVGISQNVEYRLNHHATGARPVKLGNAIKKYGKQAFVIEPLYYSIDRYDTATLPVVEADLIIAFDSIAHGYNIQAASGAVGPYGPAFGAIMRARKLPPHSEETKAKMRANNADPVFKERHREATRAAMTTPEVVARLVAASKAKVADPDFLARVAKTLREVHARPDSPFAPFYVDAEFQARRIAAVIESKKRPDVIEKMINLPAKSNSVLGVRGVGLTKNGRRFRAYIKDTGKLVHLGHFDTLEEAREAYRVAARRIHGDVFKG